MPSRSDTAGGAEPGAAHATRPPGSFRRTVAAAGYLGFARYLPWSPRPGGRLARRLRGQLAGHMLDYCGSDVNVEHGAWFGSGRGVQLGDRSDIGMDALVIGPIEIGRDVMMGPRCILVATTHETAALDVPMNRQGFKDGRTIVIEDDVWIGAGVVILPGRRIGTGSVVGAGSVVAHDVPPRAVVAGNPAVVVRTRGDRPNGQGLP
jgi:maltose O-acetyltransferase